MIKEDNTYFCNISFPYLKMKNCNRVWKSLVLLYAFILTFSCMEERPHRLSLPDGAHIVSGIPTIVDFERIGLGCVDCQLTDICRWKYRKREMDGLGDDYNANIVCIIEAPDVLIPKVMRKIEQRMGASIEVLYSSTDSCNICLFGRGLHHYTVLLDSFGRIVYEGNNPLKNPRDFSAYIERIKQLKHIP